jgi:hypothetical protein
MRFKIVDGFLDTQMSNIHFRIMHFDYYSLYLGPANAIPALNIYFSFIISVVVFDSFLQFNFLYDWEL